MLEADNGAALAAPDAGTVDAATPSNEAVKDNSWESIDQTMDKAYDDFVTPRDDNGQFKGEAKAAPAEGVIAPAEKEPEASPSVASAEPAPQAIVAPQSLPADLKADLGKAPPAIQAWIVKREAESHQRISELGQQVKNYEPVRSVIERYGATFQKNGLQPHEGIARMMAVNDMLESDAPSAIRKIAEAYGVDLSGQPPSEGQESGEVRSLKAKIATLERTVGETHNTVMARVKSENDAAQATLAKLVEDFAAGKDDFKDVENDVVAHVTAIRNAEPGLEPTKLLEKAYEAAKWANPVTRAKMLESERKADEAKRTEATKAKADAAKKAGSLNVKSGSGTTPHKKTSWEDTMSAVADRVYSQ